MTSDASTASLPGEARALTDAINAIAAKVDLPLDLAAGLLRAVDAYASECSAKAVVDERERCAQLAERHEAFYLARGDDGHDGPPSSMEPFADLLRQDQP